MTAERWKQIRAAFDSVVEKEPAERLAYLFSISQNDLELRAEVQELLASFHETTRDFLEQPPAPLSLNETIVDSMEGRRIGPYQLIRRIGKGGMGTVYAARRADNQYKQLVAVKLVKPGMDSEEILRRFRTERQVLATLDHPNIARMMDGGTTDDSIPYLVMEYVEGLPIDQYCASRNLSVSDRIRLFIQVCSAVHYAHQNLVIHRDLKPGNVLVTSEGVIKLLDFGIAKLIRPEYSQDGIDLTRTNLRPMTPEFASPEQIKGEPMTTASDIYSLGILLYRLITGHHPYRFKTRTPADIEHAILETEPERPSVSVTHEKIEGAIPEGTTEKLRRRLGGDLDMIVLMSMRKEPQRRYASVEQLAEDLRRHLDGLPVRARKDTIPYRLSKFVHRNTAAVIAGTLVFFALLISFLITANAARTARRERANAERRFEDVRHLARFVLFDFDDAIRSGVTPARKLAVTKALDYLNNLSADSADHPGIQRELIEGYWRVGDVQGNPYEPHLGDRAGAKESYAKALSLSEQINDPVYVALSNVRVGDMLALDNNRAEAERRYKQAEQVFSSRSDLDSLRRLMDVSRKMGFLYYRAGDTKSALDAYGRYLKIAEQIYSQGNTSIRDRRAVAYGNERVGFIEARSGNVESGLDKLRRALATYETLAREDPNSVSAKRDVASVYTLIGDILKSNDRPKEAVQNYERALQVTHELSAADPKNVLYSRDLHLTLGHLSEAFVQAGMVADAQKATDQAIRVLKPLVDDPEPDDTDIYQYCMLLLEPKYKNIYDPFTARKYAEKLVERAGGKDPRTLELLASAHAAAGDYSRAIDAQSRALLLLPPQSTSDLRKLMEKELADYRERAAKRR